MHRTQIYITESQEKGLKRLAKRRSMKQSELIREALDNYLSSQEMESFRQRLNDVSGLWADRSEVVSQMATIRRELDRA